MKKILPVLLFLSAIACRKEEVPVINSIETADQKLFKIVRTIHLRSSVDLKDSFLFSYDDAGRLIAEAGITYTRDNSGRIIGIVDNGIKTDIYYNGNTKEVAYTIRAIDSTVYVHDKGRVVLMNVFEKNKGVWNNYGYYSFSYNDEGNITEMKKIVYSASGAYIICSDLKFDNYDHHPNPLHSDDEVRLSNEFWTLESCSFNNAGKGNTFISKSFEYRKDGRPRTAIIRNAAGGSDMDLTYYYR